jgi:hypothetical protein
MAKIFLFRALRRGAGLILANSFSTANFAKNDD